MRRLKKEDICKFIGKYIHNITLLTEEECQRYSPLFPEINEPFWTKTDGYHIDDEVFNRTQKTTGYRKKVFYKNSIKSYSSDANHIGVRPTIWIASNLIHKPKVGSKFRLGVYSFTIIDYNDRDIIALCDSLIARRRCNALASEASWNDSELKKWLELDGILRVCASPYVVKDLSLFDCNSLANKFNFQYDCQRYEWICGQLFTIPDNIQKLIDENVIKQLSHIPPSINNKPLDRLEFDYLIKNRDYPKHCGEQRLFDFKISMLKESYFLNWKYRTHLERIKFGTVSEWLESDKTVGTYCYSGNGTGRLYNFYPKDIYDPIKGHTATCEEGTFMRPLIFVQTAQNENHEVGEVGFLFEEKVIVLDVVDGGVLVVPTVLPNILHPLYKRQEGLAKYEEDLKLLGHIFKNSKFA